jgi:superfamily II DNA or RNA helicase
MQNPAYIKAKQQRRPTWGIDAKLKLYLYDQDGALILPRGYSDQLQARLDEAGIQPEIYTDYTQGYKADFGDWNPDYQLRDYQQPLVDALADRNGVGISPAGSGKTIMGMMYIHRIGRATLWLTHTTDLVHQTKARAEATLRGVGRIGVFGDGNKDYGDGKLIIATVQTLRADPTLVEALNPVIGVVVIDEAHHFPAAQFMDTAGKFKAARIVGLTATPDRKDELQQYMYMGIGPAVHEVDRAELYEDEQLIKPAVRFVYSDFADDNADDGAENNVDAGGDDMDYSALLGRLLQDTDRVNLIASTIVNAAPEGPAIALGESVRYGFVLQDAVQRIAKERGVKLRTAVVHGGLQRYTWRVATSRDDAVEKAQRYGTETKYDEKARRWKVKTPQYTEAEYRDWQVTPKQRKAIIKAVADREVDVLFATQLAREGLDIPHLAVGHSVTPKKGDVYGSKAGIGVEQEIGRIMRPDPRNPNKSAIWYDYVDANVGVFKAQYYSRRRVYKRLGITLPAKPKDTERDIIDNFLGNIKF